VNRTETAVDIANVEQAAAWDGPDGEQWATNARRYERSLRLHRRRLLDAASFVPDDDILDVGCGNGLTTVEVARIAADGSAMGIDLSSLMLEGARARADADGAKNVSFVQGDAQVFGFTPAGFDVAISSFGVMFFGDPVAAFTNIGRALRPGGRVRLLVWRELARNEWMQGIRRAIAMGRELPEPPPGAPSPFALADPDRVRSILTDSGFASVDLEPLDVPVDLGASAEEGYAFLGGQATTRALLADLDESQRAQAIANLHELVDSHVADDGVLLPSSAWLVTATRP